MRLVAISVIKDESDIIELFLRINSRVVDKFYILDNGSCDTTLGIVNMLQEEGIDISIFSQPSLDYQQGDMILKLLKTAAAKEQFDWAFILDADEFINISREEIEKQLVKIPRTAVASLKWSTWIPNGDDYEKHLNPLWSCFRRLKKELRDFEKIIIPYQLVNTIRIGSGNHEAFYDNGMKIPNALLSCGTLDHVPVRSSRQLMSKIMIGNYRMSLKPNRQPLEAYHWKVMLDTLRQYNYEIDDSLLRFLSLSYIASKGDIIVDEVDWDSRLGLESDEMKYYWESIVNERLRYDAFANSLVSTLVELFKK